MINIKSTSGLVLFILLFSIHLIAQSDSLYLSPSVYFTHGFYSDQSNSNAISLYNTVEPVPDYYLINHYEQLLIKNKSWDYKQRTFLAGGLADLSPVFLKLNFAHYGGEYEAKEFNYTYNDFTNLYNIDFSFYYDLWYLGASYVYTNRIGYYALQTNQLTLRIEKILSLYTFLSLKPTYSRTNDNREFYSVQAKIHYLLQDDILLKAGGFIGKRVNYFDSDLLTFFNQEDVQKYQLFAQVEYDILRWLKFILSYQKSEFEHFGINYIVLGIKSNLYL